MFKMATQREFTAPWFTEALKMVGEQSNNHRKQWELAYVTHVVTFKHLCPRDWANN